jgi:hypothetical protein
MSEIIIHIGTHKTGTTTIQDTLFQNRRLLRQHGVVYPRIGRVAPHHNLVTRWIELPGQFLARRSALENWASLARGYAGGADTVLVSSEEFSRLRPTAVDFRELAGLVAGFGRARIACTLRNQLGYIQSIYVQVTKTQRFIDFDAFVDHCLRSRYATGLALDYSVLMASVLRGFAREEVTLIPYEQAATRGGLVAHFCRSLGLPVAGEELVPLPAGDSNVSPTPLALWLANQAAAPEVARGGQVAAAERVLGEALGAGVRTTLFTRAQVRRLRATFEPLNRRFAARHRGVDPGFELAPLRVAPETVHRDEIDVAALLGALRGEAPAPRPAPPEPAAPPPAPPPAPALRPALSFDEFRTRPTPLVLRAARMVVSWSPKSACSHVVLWTFLHEGLLAEANAYHAWPHEYRMHVYYKTPQYREAVRDALAGNGRGYTLLKVTRDPVNRLVSMFRHACRYPFLEDAFARRGVDIRADGISLEDFAAVLGDLDLVVPSTTDPHVCAQYHPVWDMDFDRVITLNVDRCDLDTALNDVEAAFGLPRTRFADHPAFAALGKSHYAVPARMAFDGPIEKHRFPFGRVRRFPTAQLAASPLLRRLVETHYAVDLGSTDLADSRGTLFSDTPEQVG